MLPNMTESGPQVRPWQVVERFKRWDAETSRRNQERLLAAYDSFASVGVTEVNVYRLAVRDAELRYPDKQDVSWRLMGKGTIYRALSQLEHQGVLTSRWERPEGVDDRPRRRLYSRVEPIALPDQSVDSLS